LGLDRDGGEFQRGLGARTRGVLGRGRMEEVEGLLGGGASGDEKPFEALGYKQAVLCLRGGIALEEAVESTVIETRQYAKRQRTWFRRDAEVRWLGGFGDETEVIAQACAVNLGPLGVVRRSEVMTGSETEQESERQ